MNSLIINIVGVVNKIVGGFLDLLPISYYVFVSIILHVIYIGLHTVIILRTSGEVPGEV